MTVAAADLQFAVSHLEHPHIFGQTAGLKNAGARLRYAFDPDPQRLAGFCRLHPEARPLASFDELLRCEDVQLVASAAIPNERSALGVEVLRSGKDYFTDKAPATSLEQLEALRSAASETGRKVFVYYAERLHNDAAWCATELIENGAVGQVLQVLNLAPHRLAKATRPRWFFEKRRAGGILTDLGSHQVEQFLTYAGCTGARVNFARVANFGHPDEPHFEDFGEMSLTGEDGASFYARVDWYTPEGLPSWGDGRSFVLGSEGSLEIRKTLDPSRQSPASKLFLCDPHGEREIDCLGKTGFPFFERLAADVLDRGESAMPQEHAFLAAQLSLEAQALADGLREPA
jgi:predicted dehydrogenase